MFESNVILNRFKTMKKHSVPNLKFESNVILNRFKTNGKSIEDPINV